VNPPNYSHIKPGS